MGPLTKIEIFLHKSYRKSGTIYDQILNFPLQYLGFTIYSVTRQFLRSDFSDVNDKWCTVRLLLVTLFCSVSQKGIKDISSKNKCARRHNVIRILVSTFFLNFHT